MLMNMRDLLATAKENGFAVGAFNICDSLLFETVMTCAEAHNAPVIIEAAPPEFEFMGDSFFAYVRKRMEESEVPCVLHLDHGKSFADCMRAIRDGFTSVMIDGSELPYEDNVALTAKVVEAAHSVGVSVEGEIGTIGALSTSVEGGVENVTYTQPEQVADFIGKTGADTLAVAIGTAHGIYPKGMVPKLRLDILCEIDALDVCPLVLHGGSGNADDEIAEACKHGVCKVNIASDYRKAFFDATKENLVETGAFWTPNVYAPAMKAAQDVITHKMELFGCIGKAGLYRAPTCETLGCAG